ncbi:alpha/beta hydrolase [Streptomyces sparsogenes]|uniref:alpha/beta hydrolase n=1 Tax=Streptomyces sparsogenes TaxID=67365 RepID=UPI0033C32F42
MPTDGITHRTDHLPTPDGVRLATYTWLPETDSPRAIVQIAHGAAEHAQRYDRSARYLCAHGYAVVASDHRGHGATAASTGGYGVVGEEGDGWRATVKDLRTVGDRARRTLPGIPLFLLGHSMGSMLARDCAQEYGEDLAGLILSGTFRSLPATEPDQAIAHLEAEIAQGGRTALSGFTTQLFASFNDPYESAPATSGSPATPRRWPPTPRTSDAASPSAPASPSTGSAPSARSTTPTTRPRIPTRLPVHIAVGAEDPCNQRMTLVYELLEDFRYLGTHDLTWKAYPGARHEILNETNRDEVQQDLLTWLHTHT